jgi:endonuclease/exonuclease/phosphatase family metal-dependent hydrolase
VTVSVRTAWLIAAFNTCVLAAFLATSPKPDAQPKDSLRLMTLNAQFFMAAENRIASNLDPLRDLIAREKPDIIALQETDANSAMGGNQNGVWWLGRENDLTYYYGPPSSKYTPGVALLSRWPIRSAQFRLLPANHSMARGVVDAVVDVPGGPVQIIVAHVQWAEQPGERDVGYREDQIAQAAAILRAVRTDMPSAVMGDFNAGPAYPGPAYDMMMTRFIDAWIAGAQKSDDPADYTWPSSKPTMRIDLVWLSQNDWTVKQGSGRVHGDEGLSDHRAVIIDAAVIRK